ncbi:MAG: hypothetical protein BGP08_20955 [Rhizobiales bacterium 64-17]|nr:MAG: hypothetical protein BGP08_20955 [Rhizobiales bacterium 64-17]
MQPERPGTGALALAVLMHYPRQSVATVTGVLAVGAIVSNALFMQAGQHPAPIFGRKPQGVTVQVAEQPTAPRPRIIPAAPPAQNMAAQNAAGSAMTVPAPVPVPMPAPAAVPRNRGDIITDLQRELSHKGFYDGAVDGIWGAKTDMALRDFATAAGLRLTPEASEDVLRVVAKSTVVARKHETTGRRDRAGDPIGDLISTTPKPPAEIPAVAVPATPPAAVAPQGSNRLMAVQRALTDFGYGQIKPTGSMGPETQAAIERFERDRKLPVTGKLSDQMLRELAVVTGRTIE